MKFILPFFFFLCACSDVLVQDQNNDDVKGGDVDYCEAFGWYNDGRCDKDCAKPDPDCETGISACETNPTQFSEIDTSCEPANVRCAPGTQYYEDECGKCGCVGEVTTCELNPFVNYVDFGSCETDFSCDEAEFYQDACGCGCIITQMCELNPDVDYVAFGDACELADYFCEESYEYYADECGCGCILDQRHCEYDGPGIWFNTDPAICNQENIQPECPVDTLYFNNECGCGCTPAPNCTTDSDCPGGFCDRLLEVPICVFTECGDVSQILCNAIPPTCPAGQVPEVKNGCWGDCVSARTCQFICENDDDCASQNENTACIVPDCPPVEGFVCENFCG